MTSDRDGSFLDPALPLDSSAVSDVLDGLGLPGRVLAPALRLISAGTRCMGRAVCARLVSASEVSNPVPGGYFGTLDAAVHPGCVLVLQAPPDGAVLGGLMAFEFKRLGAAGILTDGMVRDAREIRELGLPVVASGTSPRNGAREMQVAAVGQAVALPGETQAGVPVEDGDLIVADDDGVVVIPGRFAELIVEATLQLAQIELRIAGEMEAGMSRLAAMRVHDRFAHLAPLRDRLKPGA